ncbi:SRP54-type protein, GTPase domain protein [Bordetella bronchiseptica A1-7]|nr:SRP54-type protein, GTPase domain protein [Bordetella bronchiseptica A1-7]
MLRREDDLLAGGGVFALVGPTGVGKTTTLAKLAARCVAREGREQVAMLTTDNFRIGALEQLQIYGRLMGIPAHSVRDADELRDALGSLGNRRIIRCAQRPPGHTGGRRHGRGIQESGRHPGAIGGRAHAGQDPRLAGSLRDLNGRPTRGPHGCGLDDAAGMASGSARLAARSARRRFRGHG